MRVVSIAAALTCLGVSSFGPEASAAEAVGPDAVWQPNAQAMRNLRERCAKEPPEKYAECLIAQMPAAGARNAAVAFTERLKKETGQIGYVLRFRGSGPVDIAYVEYPIRANENRGWLLVNGEPSLIDVDDFSRLPKESLESDSAYRALAKQYPKVMLFPGDRTGTKYPTVRPLTSGGQRFVVPYRLLNGCHACERLGSASFAFDFDEAGRFVSAKLLYISRERHD
jgi:hypothetical protein